MQSNIVHRGIVLNPLLESVDITPFLSTGLIEQVEVYGEHCTDLGDTHRKLDIDWVKSISSQCRIYDTRFKFKSTGTILRNGNSEATIRACKDQIELAKFYNLNYEPVNQSDNYWEAIAEKLDDIRLSELAYEINSRKDGTFLKNSI
jgi:hypothetical protein